MCHGTDGWIALFQNASLWRGHNKRIEIPFCEDRFTRAKETMRQIGVHTGATWRLRANDPYAVAMRLYVSYFGHLLGRIASIDVAYCHRYSLACVSASVYLSVGHTVSCAKRLK